MQSSKGRITRCYRRRCQQQTNSGWYDYSTITMLKTATQQELLRRRQQQHIQQQRYQRIWMSSRSTTSRSTKTFSSTSSTASLVSMSPIYETPLNSTVIEKPYTLILLETVDIPSSSSSSWFEYLRSTVPTEYGMSFASITLPLFREQPQKQHEKADYSTDTTTDNDDDDDDDDAVTTIRSPVVPISELVQAMKNPVVSTLAHVSDTILVARGPISALCAQYYLESCSVKGLIMIDPVLIDEQHLSSDIDPDPNYNDNDALISSLSSYLIDNTNNNNKNKNKNNNKNNNAIRNKSMISIGDLYRDDCDSLQRFLSTRLQVEPNAVPMLIIRTTTTTKHANNTTATSPFQSACGAVAAANNKAAAVAAELVSKRHSHPNGPYGIVQILEMEIDLLPSSVVPDTQHRHEGVISSHNNNSTTTTTTTAAATPLMLRTLLNSIEEWIDKTL